MTRVIRWSETALRTYKANLTYLIENWDLRTVDGFKQRVQEVLKSNQKIHINIHYQIEERHTDVLLLNTFHCSTISIQTQYSCLSSGTTASTQGA